MADISVIKTPDGNSYNLKDASARSDIAELDERIDAIQPASLIVEGTTITPVRTTGTRFRFVVNTDERV